MNNVEQNKIAPLEQRLYARAFQDRLIRHLFALFDLAVDSIFHNICELIFANGVFMRKRLVD